MSCLSHACVYGSAIFRKAGHYVATSTLNQRHLPLWKRNFEHVGVKAVNLEFLLTRFQAQCYSSRRSSSSSKKASRTKKVDPEPVMEMERNAFFVVRKGDIVGVYKSFADCQAQIGSSICDPPVSVYKGYTLTKDTEEHLSSHGLKNALYTIKASDMKEDLFGTLIPCPFQEPASSKGETSHKDAIKKRSPDVLEPDYKGLGVDAVAVTDPLKKHVKLDPNEEAQIPSSDRVSGFDGNTRCVQGSCILEFDGASKGNPGPAGAGAVLRTNSGNVICKLREGLGKATCNAAEYHAVILGLKHALKKGYTRIRVQGDSKLVCMQMQGLWKVKHEHMCELYEQANELKKKFISFQINHVLRGRNTEADAQANLAVNLAEGQIQEELGRNAEADAQANLAVNLAEGQIQEELA